MVGKRGALAHIRAASDGFSETLVPLRAVDRLRLIRKPDKTQVEIRHGDCIHWLEKGTEDENAGDLEAFLLALQQALAER